jgi:hypothetical protein
MYRSIAFHDSCLGVKLGLTHDGKNIDWGCLRTGCWGEYLDLRGRKWREAGEDCIMRSFITCTLHHISFVIYQVQKLLHTPSYILNKNLYLRRIERQTVRWTPYGWRKCPHSTPTKPNILKISRALNFDFRVPRPCRHLPQFNWPQHRNNFTFT